MLKIRCLMHVKKHFMRGAIVQCAGINSDGRVLFNGREFNNICTLKRNEIMENIYTM